MLSYTIHPDHLDLRLRSSHSSRLKHRGYRDFDIPELWINLQVSIRTAASYSIFKRMLVSLAFNLKWSWDILLISSLILFCWILLWIFSHFIENYIHKLYIFCLLSFSILHFIYKGLWYVWSYRNTNIDVKIDPLFAFVQKIFQLFNFLNHFVGFY